MGICVVIDELDGSVLIQHGEFDFNEYYCEVVRGGETSFYEFLFSLDANIGPGVYTAISGLKALLVQIEYERLLPTRSGFPRPCNQFSC